MAKEIENETTIESEIDQKTASRKLEEKAKKEKRKKIRKRVLRISLVILILFLINVYLILAMFYRGQNFTITLDSEYGRESGLVIYEREDKPELKTFLRSENIKFFTDISGDWIPKDIDNEADGSHNGQNYIAYTFYAENRGQDTINYWAKIEIEDVIKNVDEAIRVMVIKNGEKTIYAKNSKTTGNPEPGTVAFYDDDTVMLEGNKNFKVGDKDRYTIVIWVEGDDPECINDLIGGEIHMYMVLTEEHIPLEENI